MTRIFVPQPIPEVAAARLETLGEVTTYPHTDHQIPKDILLESVLDKEILYAVGEVPYDAEVIETANALKFIGAMHGSAKFVDFAAATKKKRTGCRQSKTHGPNNRRIYLCVINVDRMALARSQYILA